MSTQNTPAYMVYHNDQINPPTRTYFTDDRLLTARKAAWTFAESLFGSQAEYQDLEEVEVHLIELTGPNDPTPTSIARILTKRTHWEQPDPIITEGLYLSATEEEVCINKLNDLGRECQYYLDHNLPDGFGSFTITLRPRISTYPHPRVQVLFDAMGYAEVLIACLKVRFELLYHWPHEPVESSVDPLLN